MLPLWVAFFVSGVAGLSYELLWVRHLTHVFGATTPAVAATVAVFFAGTAIGSGLGARVFDRRARPRLAYAGLEAAIGLVALVQPFAFGWLDAALASSGATQSTTQLVLASGLVLGLPTMLLGATFPAMAAAVREFDDPTRATGLLYGLNTLGAVVGCVLVSFWWIPTLGLRTTSFALAGINLAIAAAVVVFARSSPADSAGGVPDDDVVVTATDHSPLTRERALGLAFAGGLVAIAIEVQWVRALALSFPATVYVFAVVLAAYLVGIGVGALWIGRRFRGVAPRRTHLLVAYALAGLGAWLALSVLPNIAPWLLERLAARGIGSWEAYMAWVALASVATMLPATVAMGATLPLVVGLATVRSRHVADSAGQIYAANTIGGVIGSLAGTFWWMPALGLSRSLGLLALAYLGLALLVDDRRTSPRTRGGLAAALALGGLVVVLDLQPEVNALRDRPEEITLFYEDTPSATVAVYEHTSTGVRALTVNNQYTLSETSAATVALQYRLGAIPMKLHPAPRRVLLIGFATGTTLAAMAEHPDLEVLACVEIHDVIFELAPLFAPANRDVWSHPKVELVRGDGRRHLAHAGEPYDLVVADLFVPRNPGVGALYSREHFEAVGRRLAPGGMFVTWLPLWQLGPDELASVAGTFLDVFPSAEAWTGHWSEGRPVLGLVARAPDSAAGPDSIDVDVTALMHDAFGPHVAADPSHRHTARRVLDPLQLASLAGTAPLNTLDRPVVEYGAPRSTMRARMSGASIAEENLARLRTLTTID